MSRPLQHEPFEALERKLVQATTDRHGLTAILHELSFREGPHVSRLKERAEEAWIQLVIAQSQIPLAQTPQAKTPQAPIPQAQSPEAQADEPPARKPARDGATRDTADAALADRAFYPDRAGTPRDMHKDFPGFDPGPMLSEVTTFRSVLTTEDGWRKPSRHFAVLAVSIIGIVALASAHLAGAFQPAQPRAEQVAPEPPNVREVAQLPYIPMGVSGGAAGEVTPGSGMSGVAPAGAVLAGAGPQPNRPGVLRPVGRINLTTDLANMYDGEGPQIARAAVAAAGLGINETVRWNNEKTGRHGTVTLIAQNSQRTSCYTARITRLDTKTPQKRTQQLCF